MVRETRRRVLAGVGGGTAAALLGSTGTAVGGDGGDADASTPTRLSAVKVAHMSPDAPNVDVYLNGLPLLEDVSFKTVSGSLTLHRGEYRAQVTPAGEGLDAAVVDTTVELGPYAYTGIAVGEVSEGSDRPLAALLPRSHLGPMEEGTSRVRFFHLSPDAPSVDVVPEATGEPLFSDVAYTQNRTAEVPAGEYTLQVRPAGGQDVVAQFDVSLAPGWVYTGYAVGYVSPEEAPANEPLDLVVSLDGGVPLGMGGTPGGDGAADGAGGDGAGGDY